MNVGYIKDKEETVRHFKSQTKELWRCSETENKMERKILRKIRRVQRESSLEYKKEKEKKQKGTLRYTCTVSAT
jgi:hypothetical protein